MTFLSVAAGGDEPPGARLQINARRSSSGWQRQGGGPVCHGYLPGGHVPIINMQYTEHATSRIPTLGNSVHLRRCPGRHLAETNELERQCDRDRPRHSDDTGGCDKHFPVHLMEVAKHSVHVHCFLHSPVKCATFTSFGM